jgi:phosphotransferase system HPr (HPr) family protein
MSAIKRELTVRDPIGLHARPVGEIVRLVKSSGLRVAMARPGSDPLPVESPLRMLALKVKSGEALEFWFFDADPAVVDGLTEELERLLAGE